VLEKWMGETGKTWVVQVHRDDVVVHGLVVRKQNCDKRP
jgi:hypothetical protein